MNEETKHFDEDLNLRVNPKFSEDLNILFKPQFSIPSEVDRAVMDKAHRTYQYLADCRGCCGYYFRLQFEFNTKARADYKSVSPWRGPGG